MKKGLRPDPLIQLTLPHSPWSEPKTCDKGVILQLANCDWIRSRHNVLIEGPTGAGKTYLGCALANAACRQGFSTRYYRVPRLIAEISVAQRDGSYPKLLARQPNVLVLDDWAIAPFSSCRSQRHIGGDRRQKPDRFNYCRQPAAV